MRWVAIQHAAFETPGLISERAAAACIELEVRRVDLGDVLPDPATIEGLVVMGGPMAAGDVQAHPHLARERELIAAAVARELPVLGVCLGAQLLASALEAEVCRGPREEAGLGAVTLTTDGLRDPVLGPAGSELPVLHWHEDTFELPRGAVLLASSDLYRNQAFRAGRCAYGFQFHVEVDRALAGLIRPHLPPGIAIAEAERESVEHAGREIIDRFFARARQARPPVGRAM